MRSRLPGFGEDVVTAVDASEMPAALLEKPHEIFTGNLFHARDLGARSRRKQGVALFS